MLYLNYFMDLNRLLWGLLWKNDIFKLFYGFKMIFIGFFQELMGILRIFKDL
jgi:hypothetical protein